MLNIVRRVVVGGGLWLLALPGLTQQGAPPPLKPRPEHEVLKKDLGTWDATVETMEPGKPPAVSKGVETVSLLEGGLWTITDFKGTMMGAPFHGHGTNGFDPGRRSTCPPGSTRCPPGSTSSKPPTTRRRRP